MTVGILIPIPREFVLTAAANTLAGAELYVYENLTTTPVTLYSDRACTTPAANPIVSVAGFFPRRYMASAQLLTLTMKNTAGSTIHSDDYVGSFAEAVSPTGDNTIDNYSAIINGDFEVAQRGTSFTSTTTPANSDDTYLLDRWTLLSDGNDIVDVTQDTTTVPTGKRTVIALDVETANKKFGIIQFIEQRDAVKLIGGNVTLSFQAKVSSVTKLDNLKAAILAWDGTADTLTSDVVSAWGSEGTNPTLVSNWTYENTPANLNPTTSYQTFSITANVDTTSAKNIAVFIWSDVTDTTIGDFLYITGVRLVAGSVAKPLIQRPFAQELALCQRYYEKSFQMTQAPATNTGSANDTHYLSQPVGASTFFYATPSLFFRATKRANPTVTIFNTAAANNQIRNYSRVADCTSSGVSSVTQNGFMAQATSIAGSAAGDLIGFAWTAEAEL